MFKATWRTTNGRHQQCFSPVTSHSKQVIGPRRSPLLASAQGKIPPLDDSTGTCQVLECKLGLAHGTAHLLCRQPASLQITPSYLETNLDTLLLLKSSDDVRNLVNRHPALLAAPLGSWFSFFDSCGMSKHDFWQLLISCPSLIEQGTIHNAGLAMAVFKSLGLSDTDIISRVALKWPSLLLVSTAQTEPALKYLQQIGLSNQTILQMISRTPAFLSTVAEDSLRGKVGYLSSLGFTEEMLIRFISNNLGALIVPIEETDARVSFFRGIGLADHHIVGMLTECAGLLTLSVPNLARKWEFLTDVVGGDVDDVLQYPRYFLHGLQKEIGPRFYYVQQRSNFLARCTCDGGSKISLQKLLGGDVRQFVLHVGGEYEEFVDFAASCDFDMAINWSSGRVVS